MIDQKPIKPSYLELIPYANFQKKETELSRKQQKESFKPDSNNKQNASADVNIADAKFKFKMLREELRKKYQEHEKGLEAVKKSKEDEWRWS